MAARAIIGYARETREDFFDEVFCDYVKKISRYAPALGLPP